MAQEQIADYCQLNISVYDEQDSLVKASILLWNGYLKEKNKINFSLNKYWSKSEREFFSQEWVDARYRYIDYSRKNNAFGYYKPLILSAKKESKERVLLKTMFYRG